MAEDILDLPAPPADARVPYGPEPFQFGDLRLPRGRGPFPVVVAIHGGFWRAKYSLEHLGHACAALTQMGFAVWSLEYRRVGHPGGGFPGTLADVARGTDFVRTLAGQHPLKLEQVVALGHSAGGHLALWLAARPKLPASSPLASPTALRLQGAVGLAPVSDLREAARLGLGRGIVETFMSGAPEAAPGAYAEASPAELLPLGVPQHLLHGEEDSDVPVSLSERYVARARAAGERVQLSVLPKTGHFELIDPRTAVWDDVAQAVDGLRRT